MQNTEQAIRCAAFFAVTFGATCIALGILNLLAGIYTPSNMNYDTFAILGFASIAGWVYLYYNRRNNPTWGLAAVAITITALREVVPAHWTLIRPFSTDAPTYGWFAPEGWLAITLIVCATSLAIGLGVAGWKSGARFVAYAAFFLALFLPGIDLLQATKITFWRSITGGYAAPLCAYMGIIVVSLAAKRKLSPKAARRFIYAIVLVMLLSIPTIGALTDSNGIFSFWPGAS